MFAEMDAAQLAQVDRDLKPRTYAAGQTVFYQGDAGTTVYIVESGWVRIYVYTADGQEVGVVRCGRGDYFGEMSLIDGGPRSATATAIEDTVTLVLGADDFHRHLGRSHQITLNLLLGLSTHLREANQAVQALASLDVNQRVILKLLYLARRQGTPVDRGIRIQGRLTQRQLATLIMASRESTNRALRALERKGLIEARNGRIVLLKPEEMDTLIAGEMGEM
jgi:CRP-like cAMP-binding protein